MTLSYEEPCGWQETHWGEGDSQETLALFEKKLEFALKPNNVHL